MLRFATRRTALSMVLVGTLANCGTMDSALFSGDSTFASLPGSDSRSNSGNSKSLAKIDDPRVFLDTAAKISERERKYETAAAHWGRLYATDPKNTNFALKLSENLRYIGRYEDAERILRQALREKPNNSELSEELAKTLVASGRLREGAASLTRLAEAPGMPQKRVSKLRSAIGVAFDRAGKHKQAQTSYALALRADPLNAIALSNLGLSYALSGDPSVQVRQNLAMVLALKGDDRGAERLARQDLPPTLARQVVGYYGNIGDQGDVWSDAAAQ